MIDDIYTAVMGAPAVVKCDPSPRLIPRNVISATQTARRELKRVQKSLEDPLDWIEAKRVPSPSSSPAFDFDASSSSEDEETEKLRLQLQPQSSSEAAASKSSQAEKGVAVGWR